LCNDVTSLEEAHSDLRTNSTLIVKCEGRNLGETGGALSIMTLRTTTSTALRTYIFDTIYLSSTQLRPIFDLLQSNDIRKVFFDGRKDYSALYHEHHVTLQNVLDMQIADVVSRGEDRDDQARRLYGFLHPPDVRGQPFLNANAPMYANVQMLNGLRKCVEEHGLDISMVISLSVSHPLWMERPLTDQHLRYAASDVLLIHALYNHFIENTLLDLVKLPSQSMRYVSMWRNNQPKSDVAHPLLPLGILREPSYPTAECISCKRTLSVEAF
ncbi:ribonuclease H-like domain-containing protein, partial [Mucidula mucida]